MDPDMVRQQAEAEREAMARLAVKPAGPAPASSPAILASTGPAAPYFPPASATPEPTIPLEPQASHTPKPALAARIRRAILVGFAGALLCGGLGLALAAYLQTPEAWTKFAALGPAALGAVAFAMLASFRRPAGK
jgi:hypothetical protein